MKQRYGKDVDYTKRPSEDFASVTITYETREGLTVIGEASTSWSFVGAGLRLSGELLDPEYSMAWSTLNSELSCFDAELYYEVQGAGDPVGLIHGGFGDRRMWDDQFDVLGSGSLTVVASAADGYEFPQADIDSFMEPAPW